MPSMAAIEILGLQVTFSRMGTIVGLGCLKAQKFRTPEGLTGVIFAGAEDFRNFSTPLACEGYRKAPGWRLTVRCHGHIIRNKSDDGPGSFIAS